MHEVLASVEPSERVRHHKDSDPGRDELYGVPGCGLTLGCGSADRDRPANSVRHVVDDLPVKIGNVDLIRGS